MFDPSGVRPNEDEKLHIQEIAEGLFIVENAYEGDYEYFNNRPINQIGFLANYNPETRNPDWPPEKDN